MWEMVAHAGADLEVMAKQRIPSQTERPHDFGPQTSSMCLMGETAQYIGMHVSDYI